MNYEVKNTEKELELKDNFVKYVAMLIRKYGNLNKNNKNEKEAA